MLLVGACFSSLAGFITWLKVQRAHTQTDVRGGGVEETESANEVSGALHAATSAPPPDLPLDSWDDTSA
jgi:hypothetical protein